MENYQNYFEDKPSEKNLKSNEITSCPCYDEIKSLNDQEVKSSDANWKIKDYKQLTIDSFMDRNSSEKTGVYCLQFDEEKIIVGLRNSQIKIYFLKTNKLDVLEGGHSRSVLTLAFNDKILISGSSDSHIVIWNILNYQIISRLYEHNDRVNYLKFNDQFLLSCSHDKKILVWDISDLEKVKLIKNLAIDLNDNDLRCNSVDMTDSYLVAGIFNKVKLWKSNNLEMCFCLDGHDKIITCLKISNNLIVSASDDETVRIWSLNSKICLKVIKCHVGEFICCIGFNENILVTSSFSELIIWDVRMILDESKIDGPIEINKINSIKSDDSYIKTFQINKSKIICGNANNKIVIYSFEK